MRYLTPEAKIMAMDLPDILMLSANAEGSDNEINFDEIMKGLGV